MATTPLKINVEGTINLTITEDELRKSLPQTIGDLPYIPERCAPILPNKKWIDKDTWDLEKECMEKNFRNKI